MDAIVVTILNWLLAMATAYPPAAAVLGVIATIAGLIVAFQKPISKFVRETETTRDDGVWHWLLIVANALTPNGARPGETKVDDRVVANAMKVYGDPAKVPEYVLLTMTKRQRDLMAEKYIEEATK